MKSHGPRRSVIRGSCLAVLTLFAVFAFSPSRAANRGVGSGFRTNALDWAGTPATWPAQAVDTNTLTGFYNGAVLPNEALSIDPWAPSGTGAGFEMKRGLWSNRSIITIGRWANGAGNYTATFRMNSGVNTNTNATSGRRVARGNSDDCVLSLSESILVGVCELHRQARNLTGAACKTGKEPSA